MRPSRSEFEAQIVAYMKPMRTFAAKLCRDRDMADDLTQDACCLALGAYDKFDGVNIHAWLFTILRNNYYSKAKRIKTYEDPDDKRMLAIPCIDDQCERLIVRDALRAIDTLPKDKRDILYMIGVDGASYQEVADEFGLHVGTVKSQLFRAREILGV